MKRLLVATSILTLFFCVGAHDHELDALEIRETEIPEAGSRERETIYVREEDHTSAARTVDDLLTGIAGVDVTRTAATGSDGRGNVHIRGLDDNRITVALNGRVVNGSGVMGGVYVDWSTLSIDDVEKIEVIRGYKDARYPNAVGGVVNIITVREIEEDRTQVFGSLSSIEPAADDPLRTTAYTAGVAHQKRIGDLGHLSLSLSNTSADAFLRNNFNDQMELSGALNLYLMEDMHFSTSLKQSIQNRGMTVENRRNSDFFDSSYPEAGDAGTGGPGIPWRGGEYTWGDRSSVENIRTQWDVSLEKKINETLLRGSFFITDQDRRQHYYAIDDSTNLVLERFAKPEAGTRGWNISAETSLGRHDLSYGADGQLRRSESNVIYTANEDYFARPMETIADLDSLPDPTDRSRRIGLFVQDDFTLQEDLLELSLGTRFDYYKGFEDTVGGRQIQENTYSNISPTTGITYTPTEQTALSFFASIATKHPTEPEYSWYHNGHDPDTNPDFDISRPDFSPERAYQLDLSLDQYLLEGSLNWGVNLYTMSIDDYITVIFGYPPSRVVYNIDNVTLRGLEVFYSHHVSDQLSLSANTSLQNSEKSGDILDMGNELSDELLELPRVKANGRVSYSFRNDMRATLTTRFVGERDFITGNRAREESLALETLDPFATTDISAAVPLFPRRTDITAKLTITAMNIFDTDYEEVLDFPMPGRSGRVGYTMEF
ncbi:TonB-dependent receptor plug domain-containing protein [Chitinivibrio alkaliphilus]|uniref:TonB-dependent receptor n=1 Tax=Chitinivibrio alkaliphilus ACht1 TaxID=1313304 RepID=U7DB77_9BACT|nr:TonB-dependent receptor [Chitinivibrio alkaliphilus]ERP31675.1 TonB-dependent receptor [Chitinivibrio alkaliphilus ACht1]